MKTHYELLGVVTTAPAGEIKRAFRREIARYHPDKVQHLGAEFQEIAASRAAELTEAYRVLMDAQSRRRYDEGLGDSGGFERTGVPVPGAWAQPAAAAKPADPQPRDERVDDRIAHGRATSDDVVRKAVIAKLRDAVGGLPGSAQSVRVAGFDAAYVIGPHRSLFRKCEPRVRLLARFVPQVDCGAVDGAWPVVVKAGAFDGVTCLMLLGGGVSPARELGASIWEQRRRTRTGAPVVIPVDVRDWEALFPPGAPEAIRQVVQRLRSGPV